MGQACPVLLKLLMMPIRVDPTAVVLITRIKRTDVKDVKDIFLIIKLDPLVAMPLITDAL